MVRPCVARGFRRSGGRAVLHQCIRLLVGAYCAPSHHGYQRACGLISGPASNGPFGSHVFSVVKWIGTCPWPHRSQEVRSKLLASEIDSPFGWHEIDFRPMNWIRGELCKPGFTRVVHFAKCLLFIHLRKQMPRITQGDPPFLAYWKRLERR
jgi:hypothetical protein